MLQQALTCEPSMRLFTCGPLSQNLPLFSFRWPCQRSMQHHLLVAYRDSLLAVMRHQLAGGSKAMLSWDQGVKSLLHRLCSVCGCGRCCGRIRTDAVAGQLELPSDDPSAAASRNLSCPQSQSTAVTGRGRSVVVQVVCRRSVTEAEAFDQLGSLHGRFRRLSGIRS